jgi:hypothetical protein
MHPIGGPAVTRAMKQWILAEWRAGLAPASRAPDIAFETLPNSQEKRPDA